MSPVRPSVEVPDAWAETDVAEESRRLYQLLEDSLTELVAEHAYAIGNARARLRSALALAERLTCVPGPIGGDS